MKKENRIFILLIKNIFNQTAVTSYISIFLAILIGGFLICLTNEDVNFAITYFFARPADTFIAIFAAITEAYGALFQGSIFNHNANNFSSMIHPLTETLTIATPLILAGLSVTVAFRAGLFNIGAQGQIIVGAIFATIAAIHINISSNIIHLFLVISAGLLGGAFWGSLAGLLRAYTGAHEVIVTIMLNYIAASLVLYLLGLPILQRSGASNPISQIIPKTATFPLIFGNNYRIHFGFILAILSTCIVSWLLKKSTFGFSLRAIGLNCEASKTAGINVSKGLVLVMLIAGALSGLSGVMQISGTERVLTSGVASSFGFDAITIALLGRSKPWGTFFTGLLFGALRAGGSAMQINTGTPIDIVLVVQSLIVLFIAAPAFINAIFKINNSHKTQDKVVKI